MPNLRGLATTFGLTYIPGPWMESIQVSKGAASVLNGYDAIAGQINAELKKPDAEEKLFLNAYSNQHGKIEFNANTGIKVFEDKVIYSLIDNYNAWVEEDTAHEEDAIFSELTPISKFTFLKGFIFRNNNPAVFGIRVDVGNLKHKIPFMNMTGRKEIHKNFMRHL